MGPSPFSMPSFGAAQNFSGMLQQQVSQLAPMATQWHGAIQGPTVSQVFTQPKAPSSQGVLAGFSHWLGGTTSQIGHVASGAADWLAKNGTQMAEAPFKFGFDFTTGAIRTQQESFQVNQLDAKQQSLTSLWKDGKISSQQFNSGLNDISTQRNLLSGNINVTQNRLKNSQIEGVNTAASLVTIVSGGASKAIEELGTGGWAAAQYLKSAGADAFFSGAERAISRAASDPGIFEALTPAAQKAIQIASADVVANSTAIGAKQLARATVVNLAFKYPIYYNYLSGTGDQVFHQLDNKKYGNAIGTIAFNAALMLSGGPIGYALKWGGKGVAGVAHAMFGQGSFMDYLSQGIGNGEASGLFNSIMKLPEEARTEAIRNFSALEATNMHAAGHDAAAAAVRVLKGMESYEGISMSNFTHDEALSNMLNFAKAQRLASDTAKSAGLGDVTVGRVDARALNEISSNLSTAIDSGKDTALKAWDTLKSQNPTQAWANNENFDRQMKSLISKHDNSAMLDNAIRNIKASFVVEGFPAAEAKQLSKMGYIPITPATIEAPFKEGTGKVTSQFSPTNDFFTHAVQPLPILQSIGDALTKVGMSPQASTERVYQIFTDNLGKNLVESGAVVHMRGEDIQQSTDSLIKKLSDYAHNPTRGKIMSKMPISDLRQLTTADIRTALSMTTKEARAVQDSIAQSFIQVPLSIRGLGDRAVDLLYKAGPISSAERRYTRIQGAARFAWNPFFQYLRVIPKTEMLSELSGGGFISSVFQGHVGQLDEIRTTLRAQGFLDEKARMGDVLGGEAADTGGGRNISKKLLPMQERSIAGLVASEADRMGVDYQTYLREFPQQTRDTVQAIVSYDRNSSLLNSPLMRTMNVAFFPIRFETKVATVMAKSLAKTSLMTQVSVINGMMQAHQWLNSPEGQAWYSRNSQAIGFFEYITPVAELNQVFQSLMPGHDHTLGNFGELGGLPFGWIPQLLDAEGLTHFNQTGVNPQTGQLYSQYIPASTKGQVAIAIQDFIGTLFSYPGAQMGLPSKSSITRSVALGVTGASKKTDLQLSTPSPSTLSQGQQNFIQAIQSQNQQSPQMTQVPQNTQHFQTTYDMRAGLNVPSTAQPTPEGKSSSGKSKLKKGQRIPTLLPGQTSLGQL